MPFPFGLCRLLLDDSSCPQTRPHDYEYVYFFLILAKLSILHPLDHLPSRFAVRLQVLYRTYSCIEDCMSLRQDLMHRDRLIILTH